MTITTIYTFRANLLFFDGLPRVMTGIAGDRPPKSLADPTEERSSCGVGVVLDLDNTPSHDTVRDGIELLTNLEHRGTTGAEENTGDGAGILIQLPDTFVRDEFDSDLPELYAVGSIFLPKSHDDATNLKQIVEDTLASYSLDVPEWRDVPTDNSEIGTSALESEPSVVHCLVTPADSPTTEDFDRRLYIARRALENRIESDTPPGADQFYVCSLDRKILVYKGLLKGEQLQTYYPDLQDERLRSTFALVHARFSTNTLGAWQLAHPYRTMIHNGEFNTIQGNINWMRARETDIASEAFGGDIETIKPVIDDPNQSDTASIDNALELLLQGGRDLPHALRMLIPEAWRRPENGVPEERQQWYDFHASLIEPWDGPALVVATDGDRIGAVLDRNGLRPCRYDITTDNTLVMASEVGALSHDPSEIEERGRIQPGQLFMADPIEGRVIPDAAVFDELIDERYAEWVDEGKVTIEDLGTTGSLTPHETVDTLRAHQAAFGYTHDELDNLIEPMAKKGKDPIGSMGDDTPLTVLSDHNRPLFSYFKQLFAQVTNPPLDYIREELVTSLETRLGYQRNLLDESPAHARRLVLDSPILGDDHLEAIKGIQTNGIEASTIDITYETDTDLESAITGVREAATSAIESGDQILILSDRQLNSDRVAIPSLLAMGAIHHHLVRSGLRNHAGIIVESGDPRTVHHIATLIGYGADAVNPYLAYQTIEDMVAGPDGADVEEAIESYITALEDGLLKVMSKMGISTVESYQGAQIFEAVGLDSDFVAEYFEGTENRTEGIGIDEIETDLLDRHAAAFATDDVDLDRQGEFEYRSTGIHHSWNPTTVRTLQQAVRNGDYDTYKEFAALVNDQSENLQTLRGLLAFNGEGSDPIPIEEVEPVEEIVTRFSTAAMSLGSLSAEAHENNSIAMNRIGGKSNTGEGGEPPERFDTEKECNVKQVASGRFGVTSTYLAHADELQIKMAQGSKPGEGGQLPGHKVNEYIAHVRYATPGVELISPPPLHDIYSIEDLKQLIHDLKASNEAADINVKLVAEAGIGTIAAGVAKANADVVHISGHSGGTGASPRTSIKHAGLPWELGLAEANQMLRATGLRSRIRVSTDGGLMTGRDVAVAAMLGAEEYVFGTASLVSSGCVMARVCQTNKCPVGVATQDEDLRKRFPGEPDHVINYMCFMAEELREIMADLGVRTVEELVGRVDLLELRDDVTHPKARKVDLSAVIAEPMGDDDPTKTREQHHHIEEQLDYDWLDAVEPALEEQLPVSIDTEISNTDRTVGAILSNRISTTYGTDGLPDDTIRIDATGTAGQSFGAFLAPGVTMNLTGIANDYVGKGLSGGKIILQTPSDAAYDPSANVLIGNVALYGATGGELYVNGMAGERFGVRNSGAKSVVEGVGDHGCEYMTGGVVVVLGETGKNFAAGMSGGVAYVYDPEHTLAERANDDMVSIERDLYERDTRMIQRMVENHREYTGSAIADSILDDWGTALDAFVKIMPDAYSRVLSEEAKHVDDVRKHPPIAAERSRDVAIARDAGAD